MIVWYLGVSYLPRLIGTCLDGECAFSTGEIILSVAVPLVFFALPVVLEMVMYRKGLTRALSDIGLTRLNWTGIRLAVQFLVPLVLFYPLFSLLTNTPLATVPSWPWLALSVLLNNGLAEETMMRGFVFRHLREGRTFWRAAALSTAYFVAYHLPLIFIAGPMIGIIAVILAIPAGFVTAYVYERGNNTVWGPGLLHAVYNGLAAVFVFSADIQPIASSLYLVVGILASSLLLVGAYRGRHAHLQGQPLQQPDAISA